MQVSRGFFYNPIKIIKPERAAMLIKFNPIITLADTIIINAYVRKYNGEDHQNNQTLGIHFNVNLLLIRFSVLFHGSFSCTKGFDKNPDDINTLPP